jgi:HAMP domain.
MEVKRIYKISNKLLLSFFIITLLLLFVGIQSLLFLKSIEKKQQQITASIKVSSAILEAKYFVRSDIHILYEMVNAKGNEDLAYWYGEHQFQNQFVTDQIKTIRDAFQGSDALVTNQYKDTIMNLVNTFELNYGQLVKSKIEAAHNLLVEISKQPNANIQNLASNDPRIQQFVKEVSEDGIATIKRFDKAKDNNNKIVLSAEMESTQKVANSLKTTWIMGIGSIVISLLIAFFFSNRISSAVIKLKEKIEQLSKGRHPDALEIKNRDELGAIANSLNILIQTLKNLSHFAAEVGNRNFKAEYETLGEDDMLGNSLIDMRNKLEQAEKDALERRSEEDQRVYVTQGIAKLGEVLHINYENIDEMGYAIIHFLVNYLKANQAIFFQADYTNPEDPWLELRATYAFDRRKYIKKRVAMGDGLAGVCFFEKQSIYLTDVPENYITISSGLGEALPRNIFIVPIIADEKVEGVIELASFHLLKPYQTEMVEQMVKSIGITLSGMRINNQTKTLLEQSQHMEQEMKIREEEMRSNIMRLEAELLEMKTKEEEQRDKEKKSS